MAIIEMRDTDLQELYILLRLYGQTYGSKNAWTLQLDVQNKLSDRGISCTGTINTHGAGRRLAYTPERAQEVIGMYADGLTLKQIAEKLGLTYATVQRIIARSKQ